MAAGISFQAGRRRLRLETNGPEVYTFQDSKCGYPRKSLNKYLHLAFEAQTEVFQGHVELFKSEGLEVTGLYLLNNLRVKKRLTTS